MDDCQLTKCSLVERGLEALDKGLAADCKFLVGEEKEEISACKALLAVASPVFEKQFYGSIPEKDPVELLDIEPDVFKKMLQFIYSHWVDIVSKEEALELIKVAHKYWISDLIKICVIYYLDNLNKVDMKGLCNILNISVLFDLNIKDMVVRRIQQSTDLLLKSKEFLHLSADAMTCIVQRGQLNVNSEMKLIDAVVLWATTRSQEQGTSLSGKAVRFILEETGVLKHLRFLTLTKGDLKSVQILSDQEMKILKYAIYSGSDLPLPVSICSISKPRNSKPFLTNISSAEIRYTNSVIELKSSTTIKEEFEVCEKYGPYNLIAVKVFSQKPDISPGNNVYEEELRVEIMKRKIRSTTLKYSYYTDDHIIATGYFTGTVKHNNIITVPLDLKLDARGLHRLAEGERFAIHVKFYKAGKYQLRRANTSLQPFKVLQSEGHVVYISYTS